NTGRAGLQRAARLSHTSRQGRIEAVMMTETTRPADAPVRPPADMAGTDLLLHIGQSKTGTSAIQACLTLNRGHLQGMGILYPPVSIGGFSVDLGNHNVLADAVTGWIGFPFLTAEQHFQSFWEQSRGAHYSRMILRAEHFFGGKPRIWEVENEAAYFRAYRDKVRRLSGFLDTLNVTVLVYLRPQADWLSSAVNQTVKIQGLIGDRQLYRDDNQFYDMMRP